MNILVPMAGEGKRFKEAGYTFPKPLIEVRNKMMIEWALKCAPRGREDRYIFLVQPGFPWKNVLSKFVHNLKVIEVTELTRGALCTCLLAKDLINTEEELFILNSDQYVVWTPGGFMMAIYEKDYDGGIVLFKSVHPKWSYVTIENGDEVYQRITGVAEKNPISDNATCGLYYFRHGKDFVTAGEDMVLTNQMFNNEFYVCPVYNSLIMEGKKIMPYFCQSMYGLGTPEDLDAFNRNTSLSE